MSGALWLLPVALGDTPWQDCLPAATREAACRLTHFVAENAKTARAELKRIGHPLPLRELAIEQLPATLTPPDIERLLAPLAVQTADLRRPGQPQLERFNRAGRQRTAFPPAAIVLHPDHLRGKRSPAGGVGRFPVGRFDCL